MWTPRRILLYTLCLFGFSLSYLGYSATSVGRMDGLPPLPEAYWPEKGDPGIFHPVTRAPITEKIKQAFGPKCEELKRPIRLDMSSRNMVLCADEFRVAKGRVVLTPISIAVFGKARGDLPVEINTLSGMVCWLTFDRPVSSFSEIGSRKLVEAEIQGKINLFNNRRKPARDDDLHVWIPTGPLYYREKDHLIWTHDVVKLWDYKSKPKPHTITGRGMEMELHADGGPRDGKPAGRKQAKEGVSGVNWVKLHSNVEMYLYVDGKNTLVSAGKPGAAPPAIRPDGPGKGKPAAEPEKATLHITTEGPFRYDIQEHHDLATFEVPPPGARPLTTPQHVQVVRTCERQVNGQKRTQADILTCARLVLQLKRRDSGAKPPAGAKEPKEEKAGEGIEVETVHATGTGKNVVLTSDAERLEAHGCDFFHDASKGVTLLKGDPEVDVLKEDSEIHARELHIQDVKPLGPLPSSISPVQNTGSGQPAPKPRQDIHAKGPGWIRMVDNKPAATNPVVASPVAPPVLPPPGAKPAAPAGPKVTRAFWDTLLTSTQEGGEDLLTLTGNARFVDEQTGQSLKADILKVWLEDADKGQSTPAQGATGGRKPRHLEATGNVVARSREANIHDTSRLVVWFKDVPPETHLPPPGIDAPVKKSPAAKPAAAPHGARPGAPPGAKPAPTAVTTAPAEAGAPARPGQPAVGAGLPPADAPPPPRPFDMSARTVEAKVLRSPIKSTIDELWCEGRVEVHQDPAKPGEHGTQITGDTLKMTARGADLYYLVVTGDLGLLDVGGIKLRGPEINIDQYTNKAWVYGDGSMTLKSATNFQGEKLTKPEDLDVIWHKSMLFNGSSAEFYGNIQGEQAKARLTCEVLHVFFDRKISLREGNKSDEPAKVKSMMCSKDVRVEDSTCDEKGKLVKVTKLACPGLEMEALEPDDEAPAAGKPAAPAGKTSGGNKVHVSGPGNVRIWEPGDANDPTGLPGGKPAPAAPAMKPAGPAKAPPGGKVKPGKAKGEPQMKLTYVEFQKRMDANNKTNTVQFWEKVRVLNMPAPRPDVPVNLDTILTSDLPEGAMFMRSDYLKVFDHVTDGKPNKEMEGRGNVFVQSREFYAYADFVTYNQQKDQVIFYGPKNGYATMYKQDVRGGRASVLVGKKIIHQRGGETQVLGSPAVQGSVAPTPR